MHNVNMFSYLFQKYNVGYLIQKYLKQLKTLTQLQLNNDILGVITQGFNWKYRLSFNMC